MIKSFCNEQSKALQKVKYSIMRYPPTWLIVLIGNEVLKS